ncbi:hypothetical protein HUJ05_007204 [Dendroctonus ponderosae]|nr:hypothetical protein HUJ05_007204 [Dendroctonus ponderosae]
MLTEMLFLKPPALCQKGKLKVAYLIVLASVQMLFFCISAMFCMGFGTNISGIKRANLIIVKTLISLVFNSLTNLVITVQLPSRTGTVRSIPIAAEVWKCRQPSFNRASLTVTAAWTILHMCKSSTLLLAIGHIPLLNLFGLFAYRLLFVRSQGTILYICLESWKLRVQIACLNAQLKSWHTLKGLLQLSQQHHLLLSALQELDSVAGPIIACYSFCCIVNLISTCVDLVLPQELNVNQIDIICMANAGQKLTATANETIPICHKMCENLDKALILSERQQLLIQYQLIAQESFQRDTKVHADGFFSVDHSMIIFIVFNVCNNLVAICQYIAKQ